MLSRFLAQARKALLAAYYVLDEDGSAGLGEEQLVGVLTAEAGVGISISQARTCRKPAFHGACSSEPCASAPAALEKSLNARSMACCVLL